MTVLYVLAAILILAIMIFIHELGHYTAGRKLGFKILDFSIGFGPAIFQFKKNDITYALRAIPLGGACRFYGEDDEPMDAVAFNSQKVWKRILVVLAGPLMNIVFAFVLGVIMFTAYGTEVPITYDNGCEAVVVTGFTETGSRAEDCGVQSGDIIVAVGGESVSEPSIDFNERTSLCSRLIAEAPSEGVMLTLLRGGELTDVFVSDIYNEQEQRNYLGVYMGPDYVAKKLGFFEAVGESGVYMKNIVVMTYKTIAGWFTNGIHEGEVSGVLGTVAFTAQVASYGFKYILRVTVLISLSLGIFNLLPIPALDGGRLVFMIIELIIGKPVPRKIEAFVHMAGLFLLLALMAVVTIYDVKGLFNGTLILNK